MIEKKTSELDIEGLGKTSIRDRLRELIGMRSVRQAATDWGLSFSTLNNYLTRGTEPSLNVAIKIASVERVSVEWIATGEEIAVSPANTSAIPQPVNDAGEYVWKAVYDSLSTNEREALLKLIHRKGIESILSLGGNNESKQTLTPQMKQVIELVKACDDAQLREILQSIEDLKSAALPGAESVNQVSKKAG